MPNCFIRLKSYVLTSRLSLFNRDLTLNAKEGFTLIEVLVAISIAAIAGVVALPGLRSFADRQQLNNANNMLQTAINITKSNSQNKTICVDSGNASTDWRLSFDSSTQFSIRALCPTSSLQQSYQLSDVQYAVSAAGATPLSCNSNSYLNVNNASNQVTLYCNGTKVLAPDSLNIVIRLNSNPQITKTININQGGVASEN